MNRSYHFPFVVHSQGVGTFTYLNSTEECFRVEHDGRRFEFIQPLSYFLERNARQNPNNEPDKDYYISSGLGEKPAISYAEETARNMFGRNESRGLVHGFATGGFINRALIANATAEGRAIHEAIERGAMVAKVIDSGFKISGRGAATVIADEITRNEQLQEEVNRLTGELTAAHATIQKVREALRTQEGEDVQAHAKVLRQMADALVKLWNSEV